ncbi:pentatricopeptide repeat-containing protein At2g02750-like [Lotus japonicus]|uniref:pentatricopeptide repeat-containing protein At2g02750-like n=1 Tax=Lotus japonicus TaxID=34305 RepID=UPI002585246B|nr:pentatricopeptide repeat-containing protein At2g02750-like [Lotus japonicus]XP_057448288.1 pentatricopeptide repeat-containing protein At2g02750-like [Lotus japonicus]
MKSNITVTKLVTDGFYREALHLFSHLHSSSPHPLHPFTFPPLLKACANLPSPTHTQILHAHLLKTGLRSLPHTSTALTTAYAATPSDALKSFDELPQPSLASFNAALSALAPNGQALSLFTRIGLRILMPNSVTIATLLTARDVGPIHVPQVHCCASKLGVLSDVYVATSLVTAYLRFGVLVSAGKVFDELPVRNVVSYNAFMSGLLQNGAPRLVFDVFKDMMRSFENEPNSVTLVSVLASCATLSCVRQVHGLVVKLEAGDEVMVVTTLVDMYSKRGCWHSAFDVFVDTERRNVVTWNSMISGMLMNGECEKAVAVFQRMECEGVLPNSATWNIMINGFSQQGVCVEAFKYFRKMQSAGVAPRLKTLTAILSVCADSSVLPSGKEIHGYALRADVDRDDFLATAVVDMYMKCGHASWARRFFDQFGAKPDDPAFWNAMIGGYGRNGDYESAFEIFDQMLAEGVQPNSVTFVSVLSACSHSGQIERGLHVFRMMSREYGLQPKPEHFGCLVDLLGRSGQLDEARDLVQELAEAPVSVFASLLGASKCYLNSNLGEEMTRKLLDIEPDNPAPLVILSNIYAGLGRWKEVERIRGIITDKELDKISGFSMIEVAG